MSPSAGTGLASPCTGLCQLGADGFCLGCARSLAEIGMWGQLAQGERQKIMAMLARPAETAIGSRARLDGNATGSSLIQESK